VEAGLWRFLFEVDLVERVVAPHRPVDDPLRWRLADPRQLRIDGLEDRLHLRVLDMVAAFEPRGYRSSDRIVIEVEPPAVDCGGDDGVVGRWVLEAGPEGASCRRARPAEGADLRLGVAALGSLYLGGHPATLLAGAGLVEPATRGALGAADRLLTSRPAPATAFGF
jgi:predicted acetyltransferase